MTESELIASILAAQEYDDTDLPRCGPGEICPAILIWKAGINDKRARRMIRDALMAGSIKPAMITFTDIWGHHRTIKGYRAVQQSSNGTSAPATPR